LADEFIGQGYRNVKVVSGGGRALEKYFPVWSGGGNRNPGEKKRPKR
jgi:hypothetical protein